MQKQFTFASGQVLKPGNKLYRLYTKFDTVLVCEDVVNKVFSDQHGSFYINEHGQQFGIKNLNRTIFFNKSDAEKRLKDNIVVM